MRLIEVNSEPAFGAAAADWVAASVEARADCVLALPTGQTPIPLYAELVSRVRRKQLDLGAVRIFNLDDYAGVSAADPHSYAAFLHAHLLDPLSLDPGRVRLLQGDAPDAPAECRAFDAAIAAAGGIDACILGLGENGHIAFNEPGTSWDLTTHLIALSDATRAANRQRSSDRWNPPPMGLTMGIKSILAARRILLLIAGENKRLAAQALHRGVTDDQWPVSSLAAHPDLTVIELFALA